MFEKCELINRQCGYCGKHGEKYYCGLAKPEKKNKFTNKIKEMKKCPMQARRTFD
jgi:hypothetical protein